MRFRFLLCFVLAACGYAMADSPVTLEHTFDGYYIPYNFPVYDAADDDRYFYDMLIRADGSSITLTTYNEDYSIRDRYSVSFSIPSGYIASTIAFSSSLRLTDGTPFFIVTFHGPIQSMDEDGYALCRMFDARNGNLIADLGSSSFSISVFNSVYSINGKPSIVLLYGETNKYSVGAAYRTRVYSLGTPEVSDVKTDCTGGRSEPIRIYDLQGRILDRQPKGSPAIMLMPDGTAKVTINQ